MARLVRKKSDTAADIWHDARRIGDFAAEHKGLKIKAYDVRELTLIADSFVICSAASEPQMKAILNAVREGMKSIGCRLLNAEGEPSGGWAVLDFGGTIFHLFRVEAREFYDLDGLWGDAPEIDLGLD